MAHEHSLNLLTRGISVIARDIVNWADDDLLGFHEIYEQIEQFLEGVYIKKRIYSSLGYFTPDEYEKKWNEQQN